MPIIEKLCPVTRISSGPFHHFFGYYEKSPWSQDGRYLLGIRVAPSHQFPGPEDTAEVGAFDLKEGGRWQPFAQTGAWNWQQGAMLQWLDFLSDPHVIFNTRTANGYGSTILNVETGEERALPLPVYVLVPGGRYALSLNHARLLATHPTIGYAERGGAPSLDLAPADDGILAMDLITGASRLLLSLAEVSAFQHDASMDGAIQWISHMAFNPSGTRMVFKHRWSHKVADQACWHHRLVAANANGNHLTVLESAPGLISHPIWRDDDTVLAWTSHGGQPGYYLYRDRTEEVQPLGADVLDENGHCSYGPDGRWLLTDTYPEAKFWEFGDSVAGPSRAEATVILYHPDTNTRINVGRFSAPPQYKGVNRCDLHPRWSRDGQQVCIDSTHEGDRQIYLLDVSDIVRSR